MDTNVVFRKEYTCKIPVLLYLERKEIQFVYNI